MVARIGDVLASRLAMKAGFREKPPAQSQMSHRAMVGFVR
jgi:hypothetical protein